MFGLFTVIDFGSRDSANTTNPGNPPPRSIESAPKVQFCSWKRFLSRFKFVFIIYRERLFFRRISPCMVSEQVLDLFADGGKDSADGNPLRARLGALAACDAGRHHMV